MSTRLLSCAHALTGMLVIASAATGQCTYTWPASPVGGGCDDVTNSVVLAANGDIVVGGRFATAGGTNADRIARWNGTAWTPLGIGTDGEVRALAVLQNGDIVAGGTFTTAGGVAANGLARFDGTTWSAFGSGLTGAAFFLGTVNTIAVAPNGDLIVGGYFVDAGNSPANNIARWDGTTWSALGSGLDGVVRSIVVLDNGDVFATGGFLTAGAATVNHIARWDGTSWSALGSGLGTFGGGVALARTSDGTVYVGGAFATAGGIATSCIAQAYPSWAALGTGTNAPVASLLALPNDELLVGGLFTQAGSLAAGHIARFDGASWSTFGQGVDGLVQGLALDATAGVVAVGHFTSSPGGAVGRIARIASSCSPQVVTVGTGCTGINGLNTLVLSRLPMLGSQFEGSATGLANQAFVLAASGLQQVSLPLPLVLPQAYPGCVAYTDLVVSQLLLPTGGGATSQLPVPNVGTLIGMTFYHQFVTLELDALFNMTGISVTNALEVTIGSF